MLHIQLEEVKRLLPILADEIRAGRDIVIEDQGETVAYIKKTTPRTSNRTPLGSLIQRMRTSRSSFTPGITAEELSDWINDGRE